MAKTAEQHLAGKLAHPKPTRGPKGRRNGLRKFQGLGDQPLSVREAAFITHYVTHFNGCQAVIDAGYTCKNRNVAGVQAAVLLKRDRVSLAIQAEVQRRLHPSIMTGEQVLDEAARLARSDIREAFDERGNLKPIHELPDAFAAAVSSIEVVESPVRGADGEITIERTHKIKTWDKNAALGLMARYHKLATEQLEVTHKGLDASKVAKMTDEELRSKTEALASQVAALLKAL